MEHLPPVGWADVATKDDLRHLETGMAILRSELRADIANLSSDLHSTLRTNTFVVLGGVVAVVGLLNTVLALA